MYIFLRTDFPIRLDFHFLYKYTLLPPIKVEEIRCSLFMQRLFFLAPSKNVVLVFIVHTVLCNSIPGYQLKHKSNFVVAYLVTTNTRICILAESKSIIAKL